VKLLPVTGTIGAEVEGLDARVALSADQAEALRQALYEHQVLFLRGQGLDLQQQKILTEIFGALQQVPYIKPMDEDRFVIRVLKQANEQKVGVFGGDWHSDFSFLKSPPAGSVLCAVEVPPFGGDTVWANQIAAYEALDDEMKILLEGRDAIHTGKPYGVRHAPPPETRSSRSIEMARDDPEADQETRHSAVRPHPISAKPALFVNPIYTTRFADLSEAESRPYLDRLYGHMVRPDFCCRHRWSVGDVAIWDNRTTLHYAVNDYDGHRRLLYRTTFADVGG
jgi:taurine dioxygenase